MYPGQGGGGEDGDASQSTYQNLEFLINYRINRMLDAEEKEDWWKYFVNFKFLFQRLLIFMEDRDRMNAECEWRLLFYNIKLLRKDTTLNDTTRREKTLKLQKEFADSHMAGVYLLFPKAGLAKIKEDGEIDFSKMSWEALSMFVRSTTGTPNATKRSVDKDQRIEAKHERRIAEGSGGDDTAGGEGGGETTTPGSPEDNAAGGDDNAIQGKTDGG